MGKSQRGVNDGGPAFPRAGYGIGQDGESMDSADCGPQSGMTLRDYFAAHAPRLPDELFIKIAQLDDMDPRGMAEDLVKFPWFYADAMIARRSQTTKSRTEEK